MSILVLGSLNLDLVVQSPRLPSPGETLLGSAFCTVPGGKGANQAVAVARLDWPTQLVGRVGTDVFGETMQQALQQAGVGIAGVEVDTAAHTGIAAIAVAPNGQNQIIVVPGANGRVGEAELARLAPLLADAQLLLMQLEIPLPTVAAAAERAAEAGVRVMLDPAPAPPGLPERLCRHVSFLTPNQSEASRLVGFTVETPDQAGEAARRLRQQGVDTVLITLGTQGVVCATPQETFHVPAFPVQAVDTVAAGDAFNGALAVALCEGQPLRDAVTWAAAAAAASVTQAGAQPSLPTRSHIAAILA